MGVKALAERVFGNQKRAQAWPERPHASLADQRPIDLLRDEAGTEIVRELLERIDHGTFG